MAAKLNASVSLLAMGLALASGSALAYQQGDMIVRAGAALVEPQEDSDELTVNGTKLTTAVGGAVAPAEAGVDSNTQLGLTFVYMVSDNIGLEVLAATPFSHNITANLGAVGTVDAAEVKHLPPTVSVQYFPMGAGSELQPYVGVGLNYTTFFDEEVDDELDAVTTSLGLGDARSLEVDDSFGLALQLGCDYAINENLVVNAAVWMIDIDTTATFKYAGGNKIEGDVDIDPMAYMVGLGYKF
ncbi:MAG: OmpW family outer membrane protein [Pseudomonadota bacterium]|nr:outer membrane protein OmpW [Pseudomonadales bacterium]MDY6918841.1 OmpW family outer membrane protein [Pseudomonadota bacterium]